MLTMMLMALTDVNYEFGVGQFVMSGTLRISIPIVPIYAHTNGTKKDDLFVPSQYFMNCQRT